MVGWYRSSTDQRVAGDAGPCRGRRRQGRAGEIELLQYATAVHSDGHEHRCRRRGAVIVEDREHDRVVALGGEGLGDDESADIGAVAEVPPCRHDPPIGVDRR